MKHVVVIAASRSGHNWTAKMIKSWLPLEKDGMIHKFEAITPDQWERRVTDRVLKGKEYQPDDEIIAFLQVRDFFNFAASWFKYMRRQSQSFKERNVVKLFDTWEAIAKEAFNETNYIGNKYTLYYDCFVTSEAYRRAVCFIVDGEYTESELDFVPTGGRGSSFDHFDFQDNGHEMDVLNRWKWFLTEEGAPYIEQLKLRKGVVQYYVDHFDLSQRQWQLANEILR